MRSGTELSQFLRAFLPTLYPTTKKDFNKCTKERFFKYPSNLAEPFQANLLTFQQ